MVAQFLFFPLGLDSLCVLSNQCHKSIDHSCDFYDPVPVCPHMHWFLSTFRGRSRAHQRSKFELWPQTGLHFSHYFTFFYGAGLILFIFSTSIDSIAVEFTKQQEIWWTGHHWPLKENTNGIFSSINPFILFPVPTVTSYVPLSGCTLNMKSFKYFMLYL